MLSIMIGKRGYWLVFLGCIAAYIVITLGTSNPELAQRYNLTATGVRLVNLTIIVPITAIWIVAFYGAIQMKEYAAAIHGSTEGKPFDLIATGLVVSVLGFPLTSAIAAALKNIAINTPSLAPATTIIQNYATLAVAIIAFYYIGKGAQHLALPVKKRSVTFDNSRWTLAFIIISSIFSWLVISHYGGNTRSLYHMPDWLVIGTLAIPYLWVWYQGAVAAYCIYYYQKHVKGMLYQRALVYCSAGIGAVIGASVFIQFVTVFNERLSRLDLTPLLGIVYILILIYAVGYGLIAKGAKKLKALENI